MAAKVNALDAAIFATLLAEEAVQEDVDRWLAGLSPLQRQLAAAGSLGALDRRWGIEHSPAVVMGPDDIDLLWRRPPGSAGDLDTLVVSGPPGLAAGWLTIAWLGDGDERARSRWVAGLERALNAMFAGWKRVLRGDGKRN